MGNPRLAIGTFGAITFIQCGKRVEARTRFRDWDGQTRLVQATAGSRPAAERALKDKLAVRMEMQPSFMALTADSTFGDLVAYWLADLDQERRLASSTRQLYERNMRTLVMPAFEHLSLREIGVARCDHFIKQLAQQSYSRARQARMVMRLAFALAVRHEVLPRNPMLNVSRLSKPASTPNALTPTEVNAVRAAVMHWERGWSPSGPKPDGQLGLIVEVMLGTSARIGEVPALRRRGLDVTSSPPTARIAGTIVSAKGMPFTRQDHPKTDRSRRIVALPEFAAEAVRKRLTVMADRSLDGLLFASRNGMPQCRRTTCGGSYARSCPRPESPASRRTCSDAQLPQ